MESQACSFDIPGIGEVRSDDDLPLVRMSIEALTTGYFTAKTYSKFLQLSYYYLWYR